MASTLLARKILRVAGKGVRSEGRRERSAGREEHSERRGERAAGRGTGRVQIPQDGRMERGLGGKYGDRAGAEEVGTNWAGRGEIWVAGWGPMRGRNGGSRWMSMWISQPPWAGFGQGREERAAYWQGNGQELGCPGRIRWGRARDTVDKGLARVRPIGCSEKPPGGERCEVYPCYPTAWGRFYLFAFWSR
ncbi:unnamed protein product [Calypogeia fissa]